MKIRLILIAFLLLMPARAHALCLGLGIGLSGVPGTATFSGGGAGYNSFSSTEYMQSVTFNVQALAALASCRYYAVLSVNNGSVNQRQLPRGDGATLTYNAYIDAAKSAILKDNASANSSTRINGTFTGVAIGAANPHTFYWTVDPLQSVHAGASYFTETLTLTLYGEFVISNN